MPQRISLPSPLEQAHRHAPTRHDSLLPLLGFRRWHDAISMLYIKGIEMTHGKLGGITVAVLAELGVGEGDGKWQLLAFKRRRPEEEQENQ